MQLVNGSELAMAKAKVETPLLEVKDLTKLYGPNKGCQKIGRAHV